jgi:hypothetical protein
MARSLEARCNPDGSPYFTEDGKMVLEWVGEDDAPDPRWEDQTCFLCGKRESWFRCTLSYDLAFCPDCLPSNGRSPRGASFMTDSGERIALTLLVRHLWKESHAVGIR